MEIRVRCLVSMHAQEGGPFVSDFSLADPKQVVNETHDR